MKTPREVLFARHSQAEPKLDAVRQQALAALGAAGAGATAAENRSGGGWLVLQKVWRELIWPSRWAWSGMAALWLVVLAVNLEMRPASAGVPTARRTPARELVRAFAEQQRLLAELLPPTEPPPAQAPQPSAGPRSELRTPFKAV